MLKQVPDSNSSSKRKTNKMRFLSHRISPLLTFANVLTMTSGDSVSKVNRTEPFIIQGVKDKCINEIHGRIEHLTVTIQTALTVSGGRGNSHKGKFYLVQATPFLCSLLGSIALTLADRRPLPLCCILCQTVPQSCAPQILVLINIVSQANDIPGVLRGGSLTLTLRQVLGLKYENMEVLTPRTKSFCGRNINCKHQIGRWTKFYIDNTAPLSDFRCNMIDYSGGS